MGDKWFPRTIKPLTNRPYSFSRGSNVLNTPVAGGLPRIALNNTLEPVLFKLNFLVSDLGLQALLNFYDVTIDHGADSFKMFLNGGQGIEEHQCNVVPNTFKAPRPAHGSWSVSFDVIAEVTSSQLETSDRLYELYDIYGDQLPQVLNGFELWVESFPND